MPPDHRPAAPSADRRHLYGVVPVSSTGPGAGLPDDVTVTPYRDIAAVAGPAPADPARQLRSYLLEYTGTLDRLSGTGPVLPVRFGTVLPLSDVVDEVLAPRYDAYVAALTALAGRTQFTVRARYLPDVVVREVLAEQPAAGRLGRRLRRRGPAAGTGDGADRAARLLLGERVAHAVHAKRRSDAQVLAGRLEEVAVVTSVQLAESFDSERVADIACLVDRSVAAEFEAVVAAMAEQWCDRARLRLLGPMAPYHFAPDLVAGTLTISDEPAGRTAADPTAADPTAGDRAGLPAGATGRA